MQGKALLKELSQSFGISGRERPVREIIIAAVEPLVDEIQVDAMGNIIAVRHGEASLQGDEPPGRLLLTAHMDEIGLIVSGFWQGFLRVHNVGGFDRKTLLGQEVIVHGRKPLHGVIGLRPPHVSKGENVPEMKDILVDAGFSSDEEARALVHIGDPITLDATFLELLNDKVAGKAFDDRACITAIIEALRLLQGYKHQWDIVFLAAVQEEVGLKGSTTGGYAVNPDLGIALDVGFAEQPGVEKRGFPAGEGPVLAIGPQFHTPLTDALQDVARQWGISYRKEVITGRSGTDAWALQIIRSGIPTALVALSLLNMHSVVEAIQWQDVEATARWMALFASNLTAESKKALSLSLPAEIEEGGGHA